MNVTEAQKQRVLVAKIAVALRSELGRQPKKEEVEQVAMLTRVMWKTVVGLHYTKKQQKKTNQMVLF